MSQKRCYPTALALYITYFVLGISSSVMGHYKQEFAALWGAVPGVTGPRYVLLFNMSVTLIGIILAVILNKRIDIDTAAQPVSAE